MKQAQSQEVCEQRGGSMHARICRTSMCRAEDLLPALTGLNDLFHASTALKLGLDCVGLTRTIGMMMDVINKKTSKMLPMVWKKEHCGVATRRTSRRSCRTSMVLTE
eukprot:5355082-Amphidinium_carterae.1